MDSSIPQKGYFQEHNSAPLWVSVFPFSPVHREYQTCPYKAKHYLYRWSLAESQTVPLPNPLFPPAISPDKSLPCQSQPHNIKPANRS